MSFYEFAEKYGSTISKASKKIESEETLTFIGGLIADLESRDMPNEEIKEIVENAISVVDMQE